MIILQIDFCKKGEDKKMFKRINISKNITTFYNAMESKGSVKAQLTNFLMKEYHDTTNLVSLTLGYPAKRVLLYLQNNQAYPWWKKFTPMK